MTNDQKPRVSATYSIDAITERMQCQQFGCTTPDVHVSVGFDLHDHEAALAVLESAVANVRAQIEETKPMGSSAAMRDVEPKPESVRVSLPRDVVTRLIKSADEVAGAYRRAGNVVDAGLREGAASALESAYHDALFAANRSQS